MASRGRGLFSLCIYIENFKNLLVRNHWINFNIILQKCSFGDPLPRLFKPFGFVKKHGRHGAGLIFLIQLTLVISTPLISILSLMSNWFLSPDYFPYVFIVFQLRVCRTSFMSTLRLSRPSFSVPKYIFHSFYLVTAYLELGPWRRKKNVRCGAAGLSVNENHNRPLINQSIF